ncbi:MAG: CBS domain-containing protein [Myxococcota bacterium]
MGALPVLEDGRLVGILSVVDALAELVDQARTRPPHVGVVADLMTPRVAAVRLRDPLSAAVDVMQELDVRHVPVVDADGNVVGVITHKELVANAEILDRRVDEVMVPTEGVAPDAPAAEAAQRLLESGTGCVAVTEGTRLIGILSEMDFVRAIAG